MNIFNFFKKKQLPETEIQTIIDRMANFPEEFVNNEYYLTHVPSKQQYWICNGIDYYRLCTPIEYNFTPRDKKLFHKAYKKWLKYNNNLKKEWFLKEQCSSSPSKYYR